MMEFFRSRPATLPFGAICGRAHNVPAYSNGNDEYFSSRRAYIDHFVSGYEWQCVEYARRWLLHVSNLILPDINCAADLIHISHVYDLETGDRVPVVAGKNGGDVPPVFGSLMIYPRSRCSPFGHVGVITEVGEDYVGVADQNRFFHAWGDKPYSAKFRLQQNQGRWTIVDFQGSHCSGWLRFPSVEGNPLRDVSKPVMIPKSWKGAPRAKLS